MHLYRLRNESNFRARQAWAKGFTMLELLVTLSTLVVVLANATPVIWGQLRSSSLKSAAYQISSDLSRAKSTAIQNQATCAINFNNPAANQYSTTVLNRTANLGNYMGGVVFTANPDGGADVFSPNVSFNARGLTAPSQVYLTNQDNQFIYRIQVSASGGISMQRWNGAGSWF
jgi:prepilin-type N-terminal cleavage/methylation domain-containing protein